MGGRARIRMRRRGRVHVVRCENCLIVIARERSDEAIQTRLTGLSLDCFVASLPRNDGG
jgi:hypothetical protein